MVLEWLKKFFLYFNDNGYVSTFSDGLGEGSFGGRHFIWMGIVLFLSIGGFYFFKKYPNYEKKMVLIIVLSLFFVRLFHQTTRAIIGVESPWTQAFPFHMCTVLTFLLPLTVIFHWDIIKTPVYVLSIMGGVITLLMGDYFGDRFLTFWTLEGMSAHTILIIVPIYEIAANKFELNIKKSWQVFIGILILMGWATLANEVFYVDLDPNYMYLKENALPFGNDQNFFLFYVLIFFLFFGFIYGIPILSKQIKHPPLVKSESVK
ncbi:MAG: hypothetical protein CVV58_01200 [Tenericutes bacterium HGW-Tenericutes-3]|nr:MAG: hypothetical protein CVV58_01200 [Tenericutes bacterium HGW-Tenericutes-3]